MKIARVVLYIAACYLIITSTVVLFGLIAAHFILAGKTPEQLFAIIGNHPKFPKLIYYGEIAGFIESLIYLISGINLFRLRVWARRLLLWFIPVVILTDILYFYLVDMLTKQTGRTLIIELLIWILLLNKKIKDEFRKANKPIQPDTV